MGGSEREQIVGVHAEVDHLTVAVRELGNKFDQLNGQADHWKGGLLVVLALGALFGWLTDRALRFVWQG